MMSIETRFSAFRHRRLEYALGFLLLGLVLSAVLWLAPSPFPQEPPLVAQRVLAAEGGNVVSADGAIMLEIPPGALERDTTILMRRVPEEQWSEDIQNLDPLGPVFVLEPNGLTLLKPARLTLRLAPHDLTDPERGEGYPAVILLTRDGDGGLDVLADVSTEIHIASRDVVVRGSLDHFSEVIAADGPLLVWMLPPEEGGPIGHSWHAVVWVSNSSSTRRFQMVGPITYEAFLSVELDEDGALSVNPPDPGGIVDLWPQPSFVCVEDGPGVYGVDVQAEITISEAEKMYAALASMGTPRGAEAKAEFEANLRKMTMFNVFVFGDAKCTQPAPGAKPESAPVTAPPEEGIVDGGGEPAPSTSEGEPGTSEGGTEDDGSDGAPAELDPSGSYEGSMGVSKDPSNHQSFGRWPVALDPEVVVEGDSITISIIPGWTFRGTISEGGQFEAAASGTYAGYSDINATFNGTLTPIGILNGEVSVGVDGRLPGGQAVSYRVDAQRPLDAITGVIEYKTDFATGITTLWVDTGGDGEPDRAWQYDPDGRLVGDKPVDESGRIMEEPPSEPMGGEDQGESDQTAAEESEAAGVVDFEGDGVALVQFFDGPGETITRVVDVDEDGSVDELWRHDTEGALLAREPLMAGAAVSVPANRALATARTLALSWTLLAFAVSVVLLIGRYLGESKEVLQEADGDCAKERERLRVALIMLENLESNEVGARAAGRPYDQLHEDYERRVEEARTSLFRCLEQCREAGHAPPGAPSTTPEQQPPVEGRMVVGEREAQPACTSGDERRRVLRSELVRVPDHMWVWIGGGVAHEQREFAHEIDETLDRFADGLGWLNLARTMSKGATLLRSREGWKTMEFGAKKVVSKATGMPTSVPSLVLKAGQWTARVTGALANAFGHLGEKRYPDCEVRIRHHYRELDLKCMEIQRCTEEGWKCAGHEFTASYIGDSKSGVKKSGAGLTWEQAQSWLEQQDNQFTRLLVEALKKQAEFEAGCESGGCS